MKYIFLIFSLLVNLCAKSQQEENVDFYSQNNEQYDNDYYPNTNIGKGSFSIYVGFGPMSYAGNLENYLKPEIGAAVALDFYFFNNATFSFSVMGASAHLKEGITINNRLWTPNDTVNFQSYGFHLGYSVLNKVHWRINPFGGLVLSQTQLISPSGSKFKMGIKPSPVIGLNLSYRFINVKKQMQRSGASGCMGLNARIVHVPFVVRKKNVPFSGGLSYMTIGVTINFF